MYEGNSMRLWSIMDRLRRNDDRPQILIPLKGLWLDGRCQDFLRPQFVLLGRGITSQSRNYKAVKTKQKPHNNATGSRLKGNYLNSVKGYKVHPFPFPCSLQVKFRLDPPPSVVSNLTTVALPSPFKANSVLPLWSDF